MRRHTLLWTLVLCLTAAVVTSASWAPMAQETSAAAPKPAFTRKVDVGGFRLAIHCSGKGSPTVVLESGIGWDSRSWSAVEPTIAKTTRVCSYDRAGVGNSDARQPAKPKTVPAATVVKELHTLLRGAGLSPPYVLGGSHEGGFFNRLYAKRYPAEVLGLVSVDGTPLGLPPPDKPPLGLFPPTGLSPEPFDVAAADAQLAAAPGLRARPFVVLTPAIQLESRWMKWQKRIARLSTSSMLVRANFAGAGEIPLIQPDLTAAAFRLVVVAVRSGARLPRCAATRLPDLWGTCL
jgi:pimeloyl-ACP methyl ester carboxylesterase